MTRWTIYRLVIIFLTQLAWTSVKGQHCPFDIAAIIVVTVHEKDSIKNIPNLKITIVDKLGNPISGHNSSWQNANKTTFTGYIDNDNPGDATRIKFPFAKDNYVFICGVNFSVDGYYLKIEETDTVSKYYSHIGLVKMRDQDKYPLCGTYDDYEYSPYYDGRLYKPIEVIMKRKK